MTAKPPLASVKMEGCAGKLERPAHLQAIWHMLTHHRGYQELGTDYFDRVRKADLTKALVRRPEKLGHKVVIQEAA